MANQIDSIRKRWQQCPVPMGSMASNDDGYFTVAHLDAKARHDVPWLTLDTSHVRTYDPENLTATMDERLDQALQVACAYRADVGALLERIEELKSTIEQRSELRDRREIGLQMAGILHRLADGEAVPPRLYVTLYQAWDAIQVRK